MDKYKRGLVFLVPIFDQSDLHQNVTVFLVPNFDQSDLHQSVYIQGPNAGIPQVLIRSWQPLSTQAANQLVQSTTPTKPIWKQSKLTKLFSAHQSVATIAYNYQPNANWPNKTKLINETKSLKVGIVKLNNLKRVAIESLWRYSAS